MCLSSVLRAAGLSALSLFISVLSSACISELPELERTQSERGTLGEEVYKVVCRRVAGTEMPADLDGRRSEALCLGDADMANAAMQALPETPENARMRALAAHRAQLIEAVDATMPEGVGDELELFLRDLLFLYDDERPQQATRAMAAALEGLLADDAALEGLSRMGREGMVPGDSTYGAIRAMAGYERLGQVMKVMLPIVTRDPQASESLQQVLNGMAFELAAAKLDDEANEDLERLKDLLTREHPDFASGQPLWVAQRDSRGLPVPMPVDGVIVPEPFVDTDGDQLADVDADGKFLTVEGFTGTIPAPFGQAGEASTARDEFGRALRTTGGLEEGLQAQLLYRYANVDSSALRAAAGESAALFDPEKRIAINMSLAMPALFGDNRMIETDYGSFDWKYWAPDSLNSPLVDLTHASAVLVDKPIFDQGLDMTQRLFEQHEDLLAPIIHGLVTLDQDSRPGSGRHEAAELLEGHPFWDQMLLEAERLSRRSKVEGETLLEALLRASVGIFGDGTGRVDERGKHAGAILATMLRYTDEFRLTTDLNAPPVGFFETRVNREAGDTPVTCGKDGCGGRWEGSRFEFLFEDIDTTASNYPRCLIQRPRRFGMDCGDAPNQSIFQRSMGLVWEMAGRSQVNKPVTITSLLEGSAFAGDPCRPEDGPPILDQEECRDARVQRQAELEEAVQSSWNLVKADYSCDGAPSSPCTAYIDEFPSAFIDPTRSDDALAAAVQPGHLFDFPDVGRVFGAAMTGSFEVEIPNPWVRRYLEDVALAGLEGRPDCTEGIVDPTRDPGCVVPAAANARDLYREGDDPITDDVDTLDELMEYLSGVKGLTTRPTASALSRAMFAPPGSSSSLLVFNPPVLHGSPRFCSAQELESKSNMCPADDTAGDPEGCCIAEEDPVLRHRIDTYYGGTALAWEVLFNFTDGTSLTFTEAQAPYAAAINRHDFVAGVDNRTQFETTGYLISTIGKLVAEHWDSDGANAYATFRNSNEGERGERWFREGTGLVKYEELIADALDDGMIVHVPDDENLHDNPESHDRALGLQYHAFNMAKALLAMDFGEAGDGLDVSSELYEQFLNPHAHCAGPGGDRRVIGGIGACHRAIRGDDGYLSPIQGPSRSKLPDGGLAPGNYFLCKTGSDEDNCEDGSNGEAVRFASPLYLALNALGRIDDKLESDEDMKTAFRAARSELIDHFGVVEDGLLQNRRMRGLILVFLDFLRERWSEEAAAGALADLRFDMVDDTRTLVEHPVFAGGLEMMKNMSDEPEALDEMTRFGYALLDDGGESSTSFRALITAMGDLVQMLPGDESTDAFLKAVSDSIAVGVTDAVAGDRDQLPSVEQGALWQQMTLTRDSVDRDADDVLQRVMNNLSVVPEGGSRTPIDAFMEAWTETNRLEPGAGGVMSAADWGSAVQAMQDVLTDERRGMERLFDLVRCREAGRKDPTCPGN